MIAKCTIALVAACGLMLTSGNDDDVNLEGVKCIIMGRASAKAQNSAEFMEGNVYLCCKKCLAAFNSDKEKHGDKARHQMVLTGQYTQKGCPISGAAVDKEQTTKVGGAEVAFCCGNCKGKVEKAEMADKVKFVFSEAAFKKGFEKKKAGDKQDSDKQSSAKSAIK